jgi:hypothetical protein
MKISKWLIETFAWYVVLVVFLSLFVLDFKDSFIVTTLLCVFGWGMMIVYPFFDSLFFFLWKKETSDHLTMRYFFITLLGLIMIVGSVIIFKALYVNS